MKKVFALVPILGLALIAGPQADNTKANQHADHSTTAEDQSNAKNDVELTKKIRREITKNSDLSVYAHNIKIVAKKGVVTLKGPVRSEAEKQQVLSVAQQVAGSAKVINDIQVVSEK